MRSCRGRRWSGSAASAINEVAVTNTIRIPTSGSSTAESAVDRGLMAKAIGYEHSNQSVSALFE